MRSILFVLLLVILSVISAYSQNTEDSIFVKENFLNNSYFQSGMEITKSQARQLLEAKPELAGLIKASNSQKTIGWMVLFGGLSVQAVSIIKLVFYYNDRAEIDRYNNFNHDLQMGYPDFDDNIFFIAGAGVALDIIGLSFLESGNRNFRQAINKFNKSAYHSENLDKGCFNLYIGCNRIGFSCQF